MRICLEGFLNLGFPSLITDYLLFNVSVDDDDGDDGDAGDNSGDKDDDQMRLHQSGTTT